MDRFDLLGPLPAERSTTVLEASAGTGKTFSLAGLAVRYIAEGDVKASELCVVSFTEAATAELRTHPVELVEALHHLAGREKSDDPVIGLLLTDPEMRSTYLGGWPARGVRRRHHRHHPRLAPGWSPRGGGGLDVVHGRRPDVDEVVNDRFLERFAAAGGWPAEAAKVAAPRLRMPDAELFVPDRTAITSRPARPGRLPTSSSPWSTTS
jgi:exodeoxyribonuclease V beta subunit